MKKYLIFVFGCYLLQTTLATVCYAQQWAENMFEERRHSFGTVAIGVEAVHRFKFKNPYPEDVHIASVTSSCGCTSVFWPNKPVRFGETGEIVARLNTDGRFKEYKPATLTVLIDRPHRAEVQLQVTSYIRPDVVVTPGNAEFGTVSEGREVSKKLRMQYAGRPDWQLVKIERTNPHIEVRADEIERGKGRVVYDITVTMLDSMPSGYVHDIVRFVTNDNTPNGSVVTLPVQGYVTAPLVAKPSPFVVGFVKPGETIKKNLVLRSETPFRITKITSHDPRFQFAVSNMERRVHVLPIVFSADSDYGELTEPIVIHTSLNEHQKILLTTQGKVFHEGMFSAPRQMLAESSAKQTDDARETSFLAMGESAEQEETVPSVNEAVTSSRSTMSFRVEMPATNHPEPVATELPQKTDVPLVAQNTDQNQNMVASTVSPFVSPVNENEGPVEAVAENAKPEMMRAVASDQETHTTAGMFSVSVEDVEATPEAVPSKAVDFVQSDPVIPQVEKIASQKNIAQDKVAHELQGSQPLLPHAEKNVVADVAKTSSPNVLSSNDWEELQFEPVTESGQNAQVSLPTSVPQDIFNIGNAKRNEEQTNIPTPVDSTMSGFEIVAETTDRFVTVPQMTESSISQNPVIPEPNPFATAESGATSELRNITALNSPMTEPQEHLVDGTANLSGASPLAFTSPSVKNNLAMISEQTPVSTDFSDVFDIVGDTNHATQPFVSGDGTLPNASTKESENANSVGQLQDSPIKVMPRIARAVPVTNTPKVPPVHGMTSVDEPSVSGEQADQRSVAPMLSATVKSSESAPQMSLFGNETNMASEEELLIASLFGSVANVSEDVKTSHSGTVLQAPRETKTIETNRGELQPLETTDLSTLPDSLVPINHSENDEEMMLTTIRQPEVGLPPSGLQMRRNAPNVSPQVPPQYPVYEMSNSHNGDASVTVQGIPLPRLSQNHPAGQEPPAMLQSSRNTSNNATQSRTQRPTQATRQSQQQPTANPQQQLTVQQMQQRAMYQQMQQRQAAAAQSGRNALPSQMPAATPLRTTNIAKAPQQQQVLPPAPKQNTYQPMTPAPVFR